MTPHVWFKKLRFHARQPSVSTCIFLKFWIFRIFSNFCYNSLFLFGDWWTKWRWRNQMATVRQKLRNIHVIWHNHWSHIVHHEKKYSSPTKSQCYNNCKWVTNSFPSPVTKDRKTLASTKFKRLPSDSEISRDTNIESSRVEGVLPYMAIWVCEAPKGMVF